MSIKVKAAAITEVGKVTFTDCETPDLRSGEALIKVHAVALCTLEQRTFSGKQKMPLPFVGGHEVSGEIAELGPNTNAKLWAKGDRVVVRLLYNCGECVYCRTGRSNMCTQAQRKPVREGLMIGPGGLYDYIIVKTTDLYKIPETLTYEEASVTEPLACVCHSVRQADIQLGEDVVVMGGGIMGIYHVQVAKLKGARVILSEPDPERRKLAMSVGCDIAFDPNEKDPLEYIKELTDGRGADVVFNTVAVEALVKQALALAGKGGRVIQYTSMHPDPELIVSPQHIHNEEIHYIGSVSPCQEDFYTAWKLLSYGLVNSKVVICDSYPFAKAQEAFERAIVPNTFRIIITD